MGEYMQNFLAFLDRNKWAIIFLAATVLVVLLFAWLRWWAFLVIIGLVLAVFFGHLMDQGGLDGIKAFFRNLLSKGN